MSMIRRVRQQLKQWGFRPNLKEEIEALQLQLTVCQFVVVVLSLISVVFLFVPLLYLQDVRFLISFFSLSLLCLGLGIGFWVKRNEICENPEDAEN